MILIEETRIVKKSNRNRRMANFKCEYCNNIVERDLYHGKNQKSCGCAVSKLVSKNKTKHGMSYDSLYNIWRGM
jgi:hypothetical protein